MSSENSSTNEQLDELKAQRSDELKSKANAFFKAGKMQEAVELYSQAIEIWPTAILHCNRALADIRLENFGTAIIDAKKAIQLDPKYVKAYYRLGSAYSLLGNYKTALAVFKRVVKMRPKDNDAKLKLKLCKSEIQRIKFEEAIASDRAQLVSSKFNIEALDVPDSYEGPKLEKTTDKNGSSKASVEALTKEFADLNVSFENGLNVDDYEVTPAFVVEMMQWMFEQQSLHKKYVIIILVKVLKLLMSLPTLIDVSFEATEGNKTVFNVCGDTHGQFYDLKNIFEINGYPSETNMYLFNGDFVDRGSWSVEVVLSLLAWKLAYPKHFHMLRGNHETRNMNRVYGFDGEVQAKYNESILTIFTEVFRALPLVCVLNKKVIIMHGGLFSEDGVKLDQIRELRRFREPPVSGLLSEILWADPQPFPGRAPSKRGMGQSFGPDVTKRFLEDNGLDLVIRSHEVRPEGYLVEHDGKLITVFSAPNYCDEMGNKGAVVRFEDSETMKPSFLQYDAVSHPPIKAMAYVNTSNNMGMLM